MNYNDNLLNANIDTSLAWEFGKRILASNYKFIYDSMMGVMASIDTWMEEGFALSLLTDIDKSDRIMVKFLLLGYPESKQELEPIFGKEGIRFLVESGFAQDANCCLSPNGYAILPVLSLFLIVSLPSTYTNAKCNFSDIYIGQDSMRLAQLISNQPFGHVLDLCAGSGIQGLNLAIRSASVTAVELNDIACSSAMLNSYMNGFDSSKYSVLKGDLYSAVDKDSQFDCIISNPPYVPTPNDILFPMCGDGGEDGMDIARKIIDGYRNHLSADGKAYMVLECIGDDKEPYIVEYMRKVLRRGTVNVSLYSRNSVEFQADASSNIAIGYNNDAENYSYYYDMWMKMFRKYDAICMYPVVIEYINSNSDLKINFIRNYTHWHAQSKFTLSENVDFKEIDITFCEAYIDGKKKSSFDKQFADILKRHSSHTVLEAAKERNMYTSGMITCLQECINAMNLLEKKGIVFYRD